MSSHASPRYSNKLDLLLAAGKIILVVVLMLFHGVLIRVLIMTDDYFSFFERSFYK